MTLRVPGELLRVCGAYGDSDSAIFLMMKYLSKGATMAPKFPPSKALRKKAKEQNIKLEI